MAVSKQQILTKTGGLVAGCAFSLSAGVQYSRAAQVAIASHLPVLVLLALALAFPFSLLIDSVWRSFEKPPRRWKVIFLQAAGLVGLWVLVILGGFQVNQLSLGKIVIVAANIAVMVVFLPLFLLYLAMLGREAWARWQAREKDPVSGIMRVYPLCFTAIFMILLLMPMLGFPGDLSKFGENFWGAAALRRMYSGIRQYVFHDIYFGKAIVSRDGWLVLSSPLGMDVYQRTNLFSEDDLKAIQSNLDAIYTAFEAQGISFYVVLPPDKNTIYPEYVPSQIPRIGDVSRLDQLITYQQQHGKTPVIDLRPALLAEKKVHQVFLSTDTHWNSYGALVATREMILPLQEKIPRLNVHRLQDYEKHPGIVLQGDLAQNYIPSAAGEESFSLEPRFAVHLSQYNISDQMPVMVTTIHEDSTLPRAVIYHDSFMIWQYSYVAEYFSQATFIWSYNVDVNFASSYKPDVVFLECTERDLASLIGKGSTWNKD